MGPDETEGTALAIRRTGAERVPPSDPGPPERPLRIALVQPPALVLPRSLSTTGPSPPVGLAYVAAALRTAGHEVTVVDGTGSGLDRSSEVTTSVGVFRRIGLSPDEIVGRIPSDVELVGIGNMFLHEWPTVREIAELARAKFPSATVVLGGENATAFWRWSMVECRAIDAVVLGEGEETVVEVARRLAGGETVRWLGLATTSRSVICRTATVAWERSPGRPGTCSPSRRTSAGPTPSASTEDARCRSWRPAVAPTRAPSARRPRCGRRRT